MYKSQDLGGHIVQFDTVFDYEKDCGNYLILTDDHADGLVHVYYGPSWQDAETALRKALADDAEHVIAEIKDYMKTYA
jgi:hypothetical protein